MNNIDFVLLFTITTIISYSKAVNAKGDGKLKVTKEPEHKCDFKNAKLVIDTDAGVADASAILLAIRAADLNIGPPLVGVTCGYGFTTVQNAAINVARTLHGANKTNIPFYLGESGPLIPPTPPVADADGSDGFGEVPYDPKELPKPQRKHASDALVEMVNKWRNEVVIITLGSLTNLAMAQRIDRDFYKKTRCVVMAAATVEGNGNFKPGKDLNVYLDPEAFLDVLKNTNYDNSIIVPWDLAHKSTIPSQFWTDLLKRDDPFMKFLKPLLHYQDTVTKPSVTTFATAIAVSVILKSDLIVKQDALKIIVPLCEDARGAVFVDYSKKDKKYLESNSATIVREINYEEYMNWWKSITL